MKQLRVLIAEDQYLTREGTRRLLEERPEVVVVGVAADYDGVLAQARRLQPDVVLMDIKMPPTYSMEGIEAARVIKRERPATGIVMLSQHDDESYVWALLEGGVEGYGYLHKVRVGDVDQLVRAIGEVAAGGSVLDPRIVETLLRQRAGKPGSALGQLTPAELDALRLMAEGKSKSGDRFGALRVGWYGREAGRRDLLEARLAGGERSEPAGRRRVDLPSGVGAARLKRDRLRLEWHLGGEPGAHTGPRVDAQRAADGSDTVVHVLESAAVADCGKIESGAVVVHVEHKRPHVRRAGADTQRHPGCRRVLLRVRQRFERDKVQRGFDLSVETAAGELRLDLDADVERHAPSLGPQRRGEPLVGEDAREDAAGEVL